MGVFDIQIEQGWGEEQAPAPDQADWLRVPEGEPRAVVVLSGEPLRYAGHWHPASRRFRRCSQADTGRCALCASGQGRQRRYVLVVRDPAGVQWLWEFGDTQAGPIQALVRGGRALRGLPLVLSRPPARAGRLPICVAEGAAGDAGALPEPVDAGAMLWGTWVRQALKNGKASEMFAGPPAAPPAAKPPLPTPHRLPAKPAPTLPPPSPTAGARTQKLRTVLARRYGAAEGQ